MASWASALGELIGEGAHVAGEGAHQAWRPFKYAYEKDAAAGDYIAGLLLRQQMQQLEAGGLPMDAKTQAAEQAYQEHGAGAYFRKSTEGAPVARFIGEAGYSPSTLLGGLAGLAPEAGATNSLRFAAELPSALRGASAGERIGLAAEAGNRFLGLPFEAAARATVGQASPTSVLRKIPAIDHAFQLSGESLAKLESRVIANTLNLLEERGVDLRGLLGRPRQTMSNFTPPPPGAGAHPTVPGGPIPGRPSGSYTPRLGTQPRGRSAAVVASSTPSRRPRTVSNVPHTLPLGSPPIGESAASIVPDIQRTVVGAAAPAAEAAAPSELDQLYERLAITADEDEGRAILDRIAELEGEEANPGQPSRIDQLIEQFAAATDKSEQQRLWNEIENERGAAPGEQPRDEFYARPEGQAPAQEAAAAETEPEAALPEETENASGVEPVADEPAAAEASGVAGASGEPEPAAPEQAAPQASEELDPDASAPRAMRDRWERRQAMAEHMQQTGNFTPLAKLADAAGHSFERLPHILKALFGEAVPGRHYAGFYNNNKDLVAGFLEQGMTPAEAARQARLVATHNANSILKLQSVERLSDLAAFLQAEALENGAIPEKYRALYEGMPSSEDVKGIIKGVGIPDSRTHQPPAEGDLPPVSGGSQTAGGPNGPGPNRPLWSAHPAGAPPGSPGRPPRHPNVDLPDEAVDAIEQHKQKLLAAIDEYDNDMNALKGILADARQRSRHLDANGNVVYAYEPANYQTTEEAVAAAKGIVSGAAWERADRIARKWRDLYETDLLGDNEFHAVGKHAMLELARELNPGQWEKPGRIAQFFRGTLPQAWKEQALLTPRFHASNVMDIIAKSLLHGRNPFTGFNLRRDGSRFVPGLPDSVTALARDLNIPVPVELTDTYSESLIGGGTQSVFRGKWKRYNPVAWIAEANRALGEAIEGGARTGIWEQSAKDHLRELGKGHLEYLIRMAKLPEDQANALRAAFEGQAWKLSPERAEALLLAGGVDPQWAGRFRKQWQNVVQRASNEGVALSNHLHFDYAQRNNLDKWIAHIMPFHFWATRNIPFYLEHLAEHPMLAAAWMRYNRIADEEQKHNHLPGRFKGFLKAGGGGIVAMLFGQAGVLGVDPSAVISVTGQLGGEPYEDDSASPAYNALQYVKAKTGLGVGPIPELLFNVTGQAGDRPLDPNFVRLGPLFEQTFGHMNPVDALATRLANATRGAITQQDTSSISVSPNRDWQIRRRIMELAVEHGEGPNDPRYVAALTDGNSPIWKQAADDVRRRSAGQNLVGSILPLPAKFAGDTELRVQEAKDTLGPAYVPGETPEDRTARLAAQAAADPQRSGLRDLYRPVGQTTEETELKQGLAQWASHQEFWANKPARAAAEAHEDFFRLYPIVAEYFQWLQQKEARGEPPDVGSTIAEFLAARNK